MRGVVSGGEAFVRLIAKSICQEAALAYRSAVLLLQLISY